MVGGNGNLQPCDFELARAFCCGNVFWVGGVPWLGVVPMKGYPDLTMLLWFEFFPVNFCCSCVSDNFCVCYDERFG